MEVDHEINDSRQSQHDARRLKNVKNGIESEKITERKKSANDLKDLLQHTHVLDLIDSSRSSGGGATRSKGRSRGSDEITWVSLLRSILVYVDKETDSISKLEDKGSTSTMAQTTREMRKKDIAEMVKVYIRAANKKGHLPVGDVLGHMMNVLDSRLFGWVGMDYSYILLNNVLIVPECVVQISAHKWNELVTLYCRLYFSTSKTSDKATHARIIHILVTHLSLQTDSPSDKLYCFFSRAFSNLTNEEKNSKVIEHLLAAFNVFSTSSAVYNARGRISQLGEELLPTVLSLWSRATQGLKEQMVAFLHTQVCVHHPLGRHTESDDGGAWARNEKTFKKNLDRLYRILMDDFESSRLKWSWKCEGVQLVDVLSLSADVINQVMYTRERVVSSDPTVHLEKRHKLQTCWGELMDGLSLIGDSGSLLSWLQLISWLLAKWPKSLTCGNHLPLLTALCKLLRETKRGDYVSWIMVCLSALAMNPLSKTVSNPASPSTSKSNDLWRKVWLSTMKNLSVHTAELEGYNLLTQLLELGLVTCDMEPWKLFNATFNLPTRPIISFIVSILQNHTLPDRPLPHLNTSLTTPIILPTQSSVTSNHSLCLRSYPLRCQLLQFLLPLSLTMDSGGEQEEAVRRVSHGKMKLVNSTSPALLAHLLVALTQRTCSSAKLTFLKTFYIPSSSFSYVQGLLEPSYVEHTSTQSNEHQSCESFEQIYLESTFDVPVNIPCLNVVTKEPLTLSRENTIHLLLTFLLEQLSKRSEMLLHPIDFLTFPTAREYCQYLAVLLETQAHHCSVLIHTALLLSHCEAWDSVKASPPYTTISTILMEMVSTLKSSHWNSVERPLYYQTFKTVLQTLHHLVYYPHLETQTLSPSVEEAVRLTRALGVEVVPKEMMKLVQILSQGKFPSLSPPSMASSSGFSLPESSRSMSCHPSEAPSSRHLSPLSDDELELSENTESSLGDSSGSHFTSPSSILNPCILNPRAQCQLEAAVFICHCYKNYAAVGMMESGFDYQAALLSMLTEGRDFKKPVHVQIIFNSVRALASGQSTLHPAVLDSLMDIFGALLRAHMKNQSVYHSSLESLVSLASHLCNCESSDTAKTAREKFQTLLSAFWGLYSEGSLPSRVRLMLAKLLQKLYLKGKSLPWTSIIVKNKKKRGEGSPVCRNVSVGEALIQMVDDGDHCVRMCMAKMVSSLYLDAHQMDGYYQSPNTSVPLLPRKEQESIYGKILDTLNKAEMVERNQDEHSIEDESVNRVSSMIATIQCEGCVSPVCEKKVVSILSTNVGADQIDYDLAGKALARMAAFLGYSGTRQLMEAMLVTLVSCWMEAGLSLDKFPTKLMGYNTVREFFSAYSSQIIPFLVYKCDEATLTSLSTHTLATPLPTLLKDTLPLAMTLIITNHAQQDRLDNEEDSQERRKRASQSNNILRKHLTQEVMNQTVLNCMDDFVVQLFGRMYEPHDSHTQLSKYTVSSDPEPCAPHFPSLAIRATLDYMPSCYGNTSIASETFVKLLSRRKDNIQRILLLLAVRIESTHRVFEKRRHLLAYYLFVKLVCRELKDDLENTRSFIIMDIVNTVVRILYSNGGWVRELFPLCCDTLEMVCKASLESCPDELATHLHSIVAILTSFAQSDKAVLQEKAMGVLSYLLDKVSPRHLVYLDTFPECESFTALLRRQEVLRQEMGGATLADNIKRFLTVGQQCPQASRSEALMYLQQQLHSSKHELSSLIKQGANGPVLQLVQGLVAHSQQVSSPDGPGCEVAHCLGEIGPTDLGCIAIPEHNRALDSFVGNVMINILYHLRLLLQDKRISVVQASAECLRGILATKKGQDALNMASDDHANNWHVYLEPFKQQGKKKSTKAAHSRASTSASLINLSDLWLPCDQSHSDWLTRLVTSLIQCEAVTDEVLRLLEPVCKVKVELCEEVFPYLIHNILSSNNEKLRQVLSQNIQLFFSTVTSVKSSRPPTPTPSTQAHTSLINPESIRTMLDMIMYLRTVKKPTRSVSTSWDNNFWLDLNFLDIAMAAQQCSAYFTSLLYIEIWKEAKATPITKRHRSGSSSSSSVSDELDLTGEGVSKSADEVKVQRLLLEAYSRIGEPDSLYGACTAHATDEATRVRLYEHEGQWHKALGSYSLQMQVSGSSCESHVAESLHQLGLTPVLNLYLCGVESVWGEGVRDGDVGEYQYEAAWKMTRWGNQDERHAHFYLTNGKGGYHQSVYNCITALRDNEPMLVESSLIDARSRVIQPLCSGGLESTYSLYPSLSKLLSLLELEEACQSVLASPESSQGTCLEFLNGWAIRLPHLDSDFQFVEPVLALRHSSLHSLLEAAGRDAKGNTSECGRRRVEGLFGAIRDNLLTQAQLAREAGRFQVAESALFNLKQLHAHRGSYSVPESLCPSLGWRIQLEEAKVEWERGEGPLAMALLKSLLQKIEQLSQQSLDVTALYPLALSLYGSWLADTQSESPSVIMSKYLEKSVSLLAEQRASSEVVVKAYLTLARYSDTQYQRIKRHMESTTFVNKKQLLQTSKQELEQIEALSADPRHVRTLKVHSKEDESTVTNLLGEKQDFLQKAIQNYILCLKAGDEHDLRVFRLVALWFANSDVPLINKIVENGAKDLETRKFLPLMYQLAARMSARTLSSDPFQQTLENIIFRTAVDHPHHCLYSILALSNASKDSNFPRVGHVSGKIPKKTSKLNLKGASGLSVDEDKVTAARALITRLRKNIPALVKSVELLCDAYMDLAYHDCTAQRGKRGPFSLPPTCPLLKLTNKPAAVPTVDIEVDLTCRYDDVVCVDSFDPYFELAGGVNLPKVISCVGSDGKRRRQLVKGRDDLRQDAVMQQVFVLVNRLLKKDPATNKRRLCVRTYKVIPLSQRSGVVEWCEETCPLGEYLIGSPKDPKKGAHSRYHPNDWSSLACRKKLSEVGSDRGSKLTAYTEICRHFVPVFHHFFMEKFPSPPQWFERRLTYTRSVAASSIVGYLLGLGDRHVQNILIDKNTAEFIHIDLGVAFEQGKTLPTPETVPFRLTRDLVNGMGIAGVEGVFRRCCEKTMVLMRAHQEELRTIVEVLLHDPLYQWTLSPLKALNLQQAEAFDDIPSTPSHTAMELNRGTADGTNSTNKMAERVLLRLHEKLGGIEDGVPLSVSGQVNRLIQEATDPVNLCMLFPGWQPWI